jgi:hypothetical protein
MKLTERKLRQVIREELAEYSNSISQRPGDYSQGARMQEKIYQELVNYLERNGQKSGGGWDIGKIHATIERSGDVIQVMWHHGAGQKPINDVKIGPDGELSHVGVGGATPMRMPDYYDGPETIINLLQGDKKTVSNYPT